MALLDALRNAVGRLEAGLDDSNLFRHRGDKGEFRERIIEQFLRPFLPPCYGLGSGAIFSESGDQSHQIDVVIYDSVFSNVLFRDQSNSLFPCESVFGSIEVKSVLDTEQLGISIDNIGSLKRLPRAESDMCDILPFRRLGVGDGLEFNRTVLNPYLGIVFSYDGLHGESVGEYLNDRFAEASEEERQLLPDYVFNHKRGYMVMRVRERDGKLAPTRPGERFEGFAHCSPGRDTLPLLFFTANVCLNHIVLKAPDLRRYWIDVVNASITEAKGHGAA